MPLDLDDKPLHHEDFATLLREKLQEVEASMRALVDPGRLIARTCILPAPRHLHRE